MRTVAFKRLKMKKVTDGADADEKFVTYEVTYKVGNAFDWGFRREGGD